MLKYLDSWRSLLFLNHMLLSTCNRSNFKASEAKVVFVKVLFQEFDSFKL